MLLVVVWLVLAASILVFAAQDEALEAQKSSYARFRRSAAAWAARGGVYYTVMQLEQFAPQPALALQMSSKPDFYSSHADDEPIGWFIADRPYPASPEQYGPTSEQARMPLSNLTTAALQVLFADSSARSNFTQHVTERRLLSSSASGGTDSEQARVFRHPFELLTISGITLSNLMGQDWNDNWVLDPHEESRSTSGITGLRDGDLTVDRGIIDFVTAFSDGKFDPYEADAGVRDQFLGDWPSMAYQIANATDRSPPAIFAPEDAAWTSFASEYLTNVTGTFRVESFATVRGEPVGRVRCVLQYMEEEDATTNWYRIVDWRQDG